jgi:hypothetical protein
MKWKLQAATMEPNGAGQMSQILPNLECVQQERVKPQVWTTRKSDVLILTLKTPSTQSITSSGN